MPQPPRRRTGRQQGSDAFNSLTPRELQVLGLLATGARTRVIADDLGITEPTVKRHLTNLYRKLGVSNRVEAATRFLSEEARRGRRRSAP